MSNFFLFIKKLKNYLPGNNGKPSIINRHIVFGLSAFIILAILFSSLIYQRYLIIKQEQKKEAFVMANNTKDRLQEALANSLSATRILSFFIENDGSVKNFDSVAAHVLSTNKNIDALELVPNGVIQYVYPLKGNESVIGYNILKDPARSKEAYKAIQKNELFFSGPFTLKQGGSGIVGRLPVFRNGKFWGFSAVVIKISTLLKATGLSRAATGGYYYQLSKINPDTKKQEFFIPHVQVPLHDYFFSVDIPDGDWKLSVEPVNNNKENTEILILSLLGFLFSVLGAIFVFVIVKRPQKLDRLVKERTSQLKESEENYKILFEKSPLPLWIYDRETFKILEVNDAAINLYGYSRQEFLQIDMLSIRHEEDIQDFLDVSKNNTEELRHMGVKTHIKKNKDEVQVLIFSRNIVYGGRQGKLVLLMDVSEKIKIENELIKSEEKYRSLIEQASDGIILYSFDGTIHSFNKAAYTQTGYTEEEFGKLNLNDLLFEKEVDRDRSKNNKLKPDQATTLYRKLKRKDGSFFLVELNARLLPDGKIIAIVRDITEREKAEQARIHEEETRQLIMNSALDAIICINAAGAITLWNPQAEKTFGWSEEEIKGRLLSETIIPEQYREQHERGMKHYLESGEGPVLSRMIEITALDRHGREFPIELSIVPMKQEGQQSFCAFIRDITERKESEKLILDSEQRYRNLFERNLAGVYQTNNMGTILKCNTALAKMFGYDSPAELQQKNAYDFYSEDMSRNEFLNAIREQTMMYDHKSIFKKRDGTLLHAIENVSVVKDYITGEEVFEGVMMDITEREKVQKQIIKEKELADSIINSLPGIFYLFTKEGKYLRWNKNLETVSGYSGEEVSRMHPLNFFDPADHALIAGKIANVFVAGKDEVEADLVLKDKQKIPYYFNGQAIEYEGQECVMGVGLDFSEREKGSKALRESEERYRSLVENATEALVVYDVEKQLFVSVSESASALFKMPKEALLKIGPLTVSPKYQPDGRLSSEAAGEYIKKAIKGEKPSFEWMHCDKDGNPIACEIWLVHLPSESKMLIRASIIDITERKKAKELLQKSYEDIRQLASNLQSIREDERTNISREIHDELGQQLTGLKMDLHWLARKINSTDNEVSNKMKESIELINATIASVRKISTDLRPSILDDLGLIAALEWQGEEFKKRSGTDVEFINQIGDIELPPQAVTAIFRIYQELLTNIARHANATIVTTTLEKNGNNLYFSITDNGSGFNLETISKKRTLGLLGIKERTLLLDGTYEFKSTPGKGTETIITIPLIQNNVVKN
jgi:PAS domain S-box-containing protein